MAVDHDGIKAAFTTLRRTMTQIKARAEEASGNIGGLDDNMPAPRAVAKLDTEIQRLRPLALAAWTDFLAAIDA